MRSAVSRKISIRLKSSLREFRLCHGTRRQLKIRTSAGLIVPAHFSERAEKLYASYSETAPGGRSQAHSSSRSARFLRLIRLAWTGEASDPGDRVGRARICGKKSTLKYRYKTMACRDASITTACYLCNTHPKTGRLSARKAVPLLRAQGPSVIVMVRRRGASRSRLVLWWCASSAPHSCGRV